MKPTTLKTRPSEGEAPSQRRFLLSLFVAGTTPRSSRAVANLASFCDTYLNGQHELTVTDIYQQPEAALREQLVAAPMLIKRRPLPERRFIGDLSDTARLLKGFGVELSRTAP